MSKDDTEDDEAQCWDCGATPACECPNCVTGEEYCGECMANHIALEHESDDSED